MNNIPLVYIAITEGKERLEISGTLGLFKKFVNSVHEQPGNVTVYNPNQATSSDCIGAIA